LIGAVLANLFGTTGASMLLIRPWLRMNKYRVTAHHVVFFIFIVANVGGCLTPIGDPPLFLGYLQGIPFWWVAEHCWPIWCVGLGVLLSMFLVVDYRNYLRAPKAVRTRLAEPREVWRFEGLTNLLFLAVILGAVFCDRPLFLRETLMLLAAVGSWFTTRKSIHEANHFNFHPIREVAVLFAGIFATMMPALDWLKANAGSLGDPTAGFFYWSSGALSSALDNAPTYLSFLNAIFGAFINADVVSQVGHLVQNGGADLATITGPHAEQIQATFAALQKYHSADLVNRAVSEDEIRICFLLGNVAYNKYLLAVSVGAVIFCTNTYKDNRPNYMVKAIADQQNVDATTFLGFVFKYTLCWMVPMLLLVWWIFFRE